MKTSKTTRILFWISTTIIFIMEGLIPALTSQTQLAKDGIKHLGYPEYFGNALVILKVLGAFALIIPKLPARIREWAYAGFAFEFFFAFISHWATDGMGFQTLFPIVFAAFLFTSYTLRRRLEKSIPISSPSKNNSYVISGIPQ